MAARNLGVDQSTLRQWVKKSEAGTLTGGPKKDATMDELQRVVQSVRRPNLILQEEREILQKAAAFFVRESR